ncbi:iron-sulfur cluster assembly accessory protein [Chlamydiia bacterium]|nr:iron-sulfur cluster assembly accessory protein [Chlamydiia bacterium]
MTISTDTIIDDVINANPTKTQKLIIALQEYGLQCVGCGKSNSETLAEGIHKHGMTSDDLNNLVSRLNDILDESEDRSSIRITSRAAKKILQFMEQSNKLGWWLHFSEKKGGCGGFEYTFEYLKDKNNDHTELTSSGIDILIDTPLQQKLMGCEIDYVETLFDSGFKITNPNVKRSCSCGSSHNYKAKR